MYRRSAKLTVYQNDEAKSYYILYELFDRERLITRQKIPARALINAFTRISVLEHNGFKDELDHIDTYREEDSGENLET